MAVTAIVFDAYGTLYDVHSVQAKTEELCPGKGELITQLWRLKQLEYTWLQALLGDYRDFEFLTEAALDFSLSAVGIAPAPALKAPLLGKYLDLDPYPEAKEALAQLKNLGRLKLAILSNGNTAMLAALTKNSRLDSYLDATISVDGAQTFKPHPRCYALVEQTLSVKKEDVLFVSSNGFDVSGAKHFGFRVAWIRRGGSAGAPAGPVLPAEMYRLIRGQAETLGYSADYTVSALTDLPACI